MSVDDLAKELAQGQLNGLYIVEGESLTERDRVFALLEEAAVDAAYRDLCVNTFDGDQSEAVEILETLLTVPFLGERRLVYVRRFDHMSTQEQEMIAEACSKGFTGAVLLLAADSLDRRKKATKLLLEVARLVQCGEPEGEARIRWLMSHAQELGFELRREAAALLAGQGGMQLDVLRSELEKVASYVGTGGVATSEDVAIVMADATPWAAENEIFQLCDATAEGRVAAALEGLDRLLSTGSHPIYILTMLARHFRQLLAVKSFGGRDAGRAAKELGMRAPRFAVERLMRQAARFRREQLEDGLALLLEADLSLKRGALPRTTLERTLLALATMER